MIILPPPSPFWLVGVTTAGSQVARFGADFAARPVPVVVAVVLAVAVLALDAARLKSEADRAPKPMAIRGEALPPKG